MHSPSSRPLAMPCLLDRLTDNNPGVQAESEAAAFVLTPSAYRDCVIRDLGWLLNTGLRNSESERQGLEQVCSSGLSFGIPALAGRMVSQDDPESFASMLKTAIKRFEPRIDPESLDVRFSAREEIDHGNLLGFEITGRLWFKPSPIGFMVRTVMDLDSGDLRLAALTH